MLAPRTLHHLGLVVLLAACATSSSREGFNEEKPSATEPGPGGEGTGGDFGPQAPPAPPEALEINEVYGHSGTTLYRLDPKSKDVTVIGDFKGCDPIQDIAIDENGTMYGVSRDVLYTIDKGTATCTEIKTGDFPNSLSFIPKGMLDDNEEALVGYDRGDYVRVDVHTGARSVIGKLGATGLESSGDVVSVKEGKTFLTVKGGSCTTNDCLVEVDPKTGKMMKNWGSIEHKSVFGLSFWGGKVYGFDREGNLFEVTFGTKQLSTQEIAIPNKPTVLEFWGAGSSTSVPLESGPN